MPDSILSDNIQNLFHGTQETALKDPDFIKPNAASDNYATYFRYKGVKVNFRDIEEILKGCELVTGSVVLSQEDREGNKRLTAYIVSKGAFNQEGIISWLVDKVPSYMMPSVWVCLEKFPLNEDGTIDKNALHKPALEELKCNEYIAPRNEKETKLAAIIQKQLKVDSVSMLDNFFRLGADSIKALGVISAIRKELEIDLDIKQFFLYPTIAELAAYLQKLSVINPAVLSDTKNPPGQNRSIVPIKAGISKMPLYIVCGGGGTAFTFEKFAYMLDDDQPVYGFQQLYDAKELEKFPDTIEEIAAKYVDEILIADPEGPYALSGHCIGGVIALEMARKLEAMGKKIKLLAMFDVILSDHNRRPPATFRNLYRIPWFIKKATSKAYLKMDFETFLLTRHPKDAIEYKVNSLKSMINKIFPFQQEDAELRVFRQFEQKFENAFENYRVNKYEGDILVFYAMDHYHFLDKNRNILYKKYLLKEETKNRWREYAREVKMYEIEGGHSSMFEPFYSKPFAKLLQQHLKACADG